MLSTYSGRGGEAAAYCGVEGVSLIREEPHSRSARST
jgi:hypothetical protein